ncbi:hypothetical protein BDV32DRAFT_144232 [Aspergillus pseudonomiae]|uniref:Uncharacterized protein n=1 Tax=Aspergillus pseudonomiae TaxID=1506151 RepID=A0A5N6IKQ8_9EURO|nr:uncharacterized protein BDV37DRAFT_281592 [Aspergillus pseudonomiae]KAB8265713.1 hypothetical protein BDV32DRAFT_144232 [Aspergillus pseudonomiae]KAE8405760.1 hypothetical protein BDV37DRAFT_281592 [Aspergillus pseudonomiae]
MSTAAKEKKRAADREAQRHNRARTKAYITYLEKTLQDLSGPDGQDSLGEQLAQQQEKIHHLQETLRKIANLAQDTTTPVSNPCASDQPGQHLDPRQALAEDEPLASGNSVLPAANVFFGMDLICSDRERNYLAVLGSAVNFVQYCLPDMSGNEALTPAYDDDFCVRAVVDGWKVATNRSPVDVVWSLLQAIDEGLFYRTDPVTRIALLRIMRSMLLTRVGISHKTSSLPDYMLPTPQFRDYWILNGMENASEQCAASFGARVRFQWPFELRDVYKRMVLTDTLSFSAEFESRYNDLTSWQLDTESDWLQWSSEACQMLAEAPSADKQPWFPTPQ